MEYITEPDWIGSVQCASAASNPGAPWQLFLQKIRGLCCASADLVFYVLRTYRPVYLFQNKYCMLGIGVWQVIRERYVSLNPL